jgi:hypothetical protein
MKKTIKAIIAAFSASIICAAPVTATVTNFAPVTGITANAASDIVHDASYLNSNGGLNVITSNALTYHIVGNHAVLYGRYNPVSNVVMPDKIKYNRVTYPVTEVAPRAFKNAVKTPCGEGVYKFRSGKYVEKIGDEAFYGASLWDLTLTYGLKEIGNKAFSYTNVGDMLNIPGSVEKIGAQAFKGCDDVKYLFFNAGSQYLDICSEAFSGLSELRTIYVSRKDFKANNSLNPDTSVFNNHPSSFDPELDCVNLVGPIADVDEFLYRYFGIS